LVVGYRGLPHLARFVTELFQVLDEVEIPRVQQSTACGVVEEVYFNIVEFSAYEGLSAIWQGARPHVNPVQGEGHPDRRSARAPRREATGYRSVCPSSTAGTVRPPGFEPGTH